MGKVEILKQKGLLGKIDSLFDLLDDITAKAFSILLLRNGHEEKIKKMLGEIDFDYLEMLLKKVVKKSTEAAGTTYEDFKIGEESAVLDSDIQGLGVAYTSTGLIKINPTKLSKGGKKHAMSDENLKFNVVMVVVHEIIHILAQKGKKETGFISSHDFTSANEAMTEILARAISSSYSDFTNEESKSGWLYWASYGHDIDYLQALMVIVARDNGVDVGSVIQAFTASYFCDDNVLNAFSSFPHISEDAKKLVASLKNKEGDESIFDIDEFNFSPETKTQIEDLMNTKNSRNYLVRKALHI